MHAIGCSIPLRAIYEEKVDGFREFLLRGVPSGGLRDADSGGKHDASAVSERVAALAVEHDLSGRAHFIEQARKREQALKDSE